MLSETPQDIEHQDPVGHRAPEVVKSIGHALHPPAELPNGEVPLLECAEGLVELESAGLGIAEELPHEHQPGLSRSAAVSPDDVLQIYGDSPKDPGQGDAVEAQPHHVPRLDRCVDEDVVVEGSHSQASAATRTRS